MLYKGSYQQHINLFPFIIDENALKLEGGSKICFYAFHNLNDDSLNYNFMEDNSMVSIVNTGTLKNATDMNAVFMDPQKRKNIRLDSVFSLFQEAKKAVTGAQKTICSRTSDRPVVPFYQPTLHMKTYPFKFLDAYSRKDTDLFFGRDEEISTLYEMIFQTSILLIYGASARQNQPHTMRTCQQISIARLAGHYHSAGNNLNLSFEKALADAGGSGKTNRTTWIG